MAELTHERLWLICLRKPGDYRPLMNTVSNDHSTTINRIHDVTIGSTRDRTTGAVTTETFIGDSPYGK
jgi:hypothetical protein